MYKRIIEISRTSKTLLILGLDAAAILAAAVLAIILRIGVLWPEHALDRALSFMGVMLGLGIVIALSMAIPRIKLSAFDTAGATKIALFAVLMGAIGTVLNIALDLGAPRTVPLIFSFLFFCLSVGWKLAAGQFLGWLRTEAGSRLSIAVYGAGSAGIQLISMLQRAEEFRVVAVVDDNPSLRGVAIGGLRVQNPSVLGELAEAGQIQRVVLAMPSVGRAKRAEIAKRLKALPVEVQTLPSYAEMVRTGHLMPGLQPVATDDLLGREKIDLELPDMAEAYCDRTIMISGAGGSIGSELCRQILDARPRQLVLFERSEYALYEIEDELRALAVEAGIRLVPVLGSVTDRARVRRTLARYRVDIVLHAAAYKHVPLVEANVLEGLRNNVFGTEILASEAEAAHVERFILVSTDKAVRPANVMGATKRLAEMVVQDLARKATATRFAMVRFGNVLGSSGSVIPLFQRQINAGGPVTVTHQDITRFFMTVPEAARLVLLAGSYAEGGDVFVLDMGEPVKILDLAHRMITLSGLTVQDGENPDGDIPVVITGLRPGEKLYEELLIDPDGLLETPHPKIFRASEACAEPGEVTATLAGLFNALDGDDTPVAHEWIGHLVEGYSRREPGVPVAAE